MARWQVGAQVVGRNIPVDASDPAYTFANGDYGIIVATHGTVEGTDARFAARVTVRTAKGNFLAHSDELALLGGPKGDVTANETLAARIAYHEGVARNLRAWMARSAS